MEWRTTPLDSQRGHSRVDIGECNVSHDVGTRSKSKVGKNPALEEGNRGTRHGPGINTGEQTRFTEKGLAWINLPRKLPRKQ